MIVLALLTDYLYLPYSVFIVALYLAKFYLIVHWALQALSQYPLFLQVDMKVPYLLLTFFGPSSERAKNPRS